MCWATGKRLVKMNIRVRNRNATTQSYSGDPEYIQFEQMISDRKLCPATAKTYRAS